MLILHPQDGLKATAYIRRLKFDRLIIGVTGNAMDEDVLKFIQAGADDVLVKPLKAEHLDEILQYAEKHGFESIRGGLSPFSFSRRSFFETKEDQDR